jgi:hypothetical protein
MLQEFVKMYDAADMVTGHYIRAHDLPHVNGALMEFGLPRLTEKLTCDTKLDLVKLTGVSKSQESLADMMGLSEPKIHMTQAMWRAANRLQRLELTERRVMADVRQHKALRLEMVRRELLRPPRMWRPEGT